MQDAKPHQLSHMSVFKKALLQSTIPNGAFKSETITSHLYRQNQQVHRVQRGGRTVALPWPPGSKSEPSCSQGLQGTSPSELLLFMPDLTPSQSSFVLGVGADLTHSWGPGPSVRASTPQGPACHMVTALLRDQDKVLPLAPVFPVGYVQASFVVALGNRMLPRGPERGFQRGRGLALLSLAVIPLLDSAFTPPAAPHRLTLELHLIFLARSVILSSGHSTFQSILGTTTAQLGQLHPCGVPEPRTFV